MSAEGIMLINMSLNDAKALRRRYGNEKYGPALRRNTEWLGEAYIEAIDIDNYLDFAEATGQLEPATAVLLRNATTALLSRMLDAHTKRSTT